MKALTGLDVVEMWETGVRLPVASRPLALLALAYPNLNGDLNDLTIGERDRLLIELRTSLSGPDLNLFAVCPSCGQEVEFQVNATDLLGSPHGNAPSQTMDTAGHRVTFRLPNAGDALAAAGFASADEARLELLRRCVVEAVSGGAMVPIEELPPEVLEAVEDAMEAADPLADVRFALACPACESRWDAPFDPAAFVWAEVSASASSLLHDVHVLATAYGWPERDILRMSGRRRAAYREMVG
jgi:hypothetical protein